MIESQHSARRGSSAGRVSVSAGFQKLEKFVGLIPQFPCAKAIFYALKGDVGGRWLRWTNRVEAGGRLIPSVGGDLFVMEGSVRGKQRMLEMCVVPVLMILCVQ